MMRSFDRMSQIGFGIEPIDVAAPFSTPLEHLGIFEVGQNLQDRPLRDADHRGQVPYPNGRFPGQRDEHVRVVGEEGPPGARGRRHSLDGAHSNMLAHESNLMFIDSCIGRRRIP